MDVAFIDDDEALRTANVQALRTANVQALELAGFSVAPYASAQAALADLDARFAGVVVTDVRLPQIDGLELFRRLRQLDPDLPVVLITGHGDITMAVGAMREGAYDFIPKPYPIDRLLSTVGHALAPSPVRKRGASAASSTPTAAPSSSTKSRPCPRPSR